MSKILTYVLERFSEASTWRGLAVLITAVGIGLNPEQVAAITSAGLAVAGAIGVFIKDKV